MGLTALVLEVPEDTRRLTAGGIPGSKCLLHLAEGPPGARACGSGHVLTPENGLGFGFVAISGAAFRQVPRGVVPCRARAACRRHSAQRGDSPRAVRGAEFA